MLETSNDPAALPRLGHEVAREILQWIGAFRLLREATIVSYNMQDYDFWGNGRLSDNLRRQLGYGASVVVVTTPPPGRPTQTGFRQKLALLEELDRNGAEVYLHERLHAKAYLFRDDRDSRMLIVGSPNLTRAGFGASAEDLLELALLTSARGTFDATSTVIASKFLGDPGTLGFSAWRSQHTGAIAQAKGEM